MAGPEPGGGSENESPTLKIDPKCLQDALRVFFQPIKTDDPRLDFYAMYNREAAEYDADYVKKYDEDLNTTLIFAGLFSAVSSAFVIDVHSQLQPDPNEQSAALLRAILLTLNHSAIPGETPVVPPIPGVPPSEIVTVTSLMYASLLMSLLAAFVAMLGKQWLNRYMRKSGGSMIERCGDRQRKRDGLKKWPLHFFIESLPVMLQVALLLLACGLCRYMWSVNTSVAYTLITLTGLGVLFYIGVVIAGMSSYACPFQTPASIVLRNPWKKLRRRTASFIGHRKTWIRRVWDRNIWPFFRHRPQSVIPLENIQLQPPETWSGPKDLDIRRTNTNDVRCVLWILRNITDPEALDAAIRLAGMVRWFEDGTDLEPPYDTIVSVFHTCFDSNKKVYPGSRDRAYYSGRAIRWIQILAICKSEEIANKFPLLNTGYNASASDGDLAHIIGLLRPHRECSGHFATLVSIWRGHTSSHLQWISNVLLHHSWVNRTSLAFDRIVGCIISDDKAAIPLDGVLNRLLSWSICLGSPVEGEVLKVQDKSNHLERILRQLSEAIVTAINSTHHRRKLIPFVIRDLVKLENPPRLLTGMAYKWCSVICESRSSEDRERLLLDSLELGFRHLDSQRHSLANLDITHTEHHQGLIDVVFKSKNSEVIADLLCAWTVRSNGLEPAHTLLGICTGHLIDLHNLVPFSPRLRQLVIRSVGIVGHKVFEEVGVERFAEWLNYLRIDIEDVDPGRWLSWLSLLLDTVISPKGFRYLSDQYWELLVELAIKSPSSEGYAAYGSQLIASLLGAQEWDKLECWIGVVWVRFPPKTEGETKDLKCAMISVFRHRPGAAQKLAQLKGRRKKARAHWRLESERRDMEDFERAWEQVREAVQQDLPSTPSTDNAGESAPSPSSRGTTFWATLPYDTPY